MVPLSSGRFAAIRLQPGEDPLAALRALQRRTGAAAMALVTYVGSLTRAVIRHANRDEASEYRGHFEITALTGTIDPAGQHLHLTIADAEGRAFGGHLLPGCEIYTTAEIVVLILDDLGFARAPCPLSGHDELIVRPAP
ncbi:PPC domain-containing DNA-binding protein [Paracoccus sp. TOH]|uniref:PPC domain-containing DNA-binding protein n=1 Tax=Paracoccus sp. TOH TaxID=1263728 RepID=UPI0025AEE3E7|nr:PPC domain-containing DNA-binding protein [Paracoccus sp. TOH]WJS83401.1 DNA-binding protein [Paracoccus sp. TOH]